MKNKVGVCFSKELQGETPLSHIVGKLDVYMRLLELMSEAGWDVYILTRKTYRGDGIFEGGWLYKKGCFGLVKDRLKIDVVYDRTGGVDFPPAGDKLEVINEREFKILAWDKWATFKAIGKYMPKTLLINEKKDLPKVLSKIKSDTVVLKPVNGLKGIGIYIGPKKRAMEFEFSNKYRQYIAQEFIDTDGGISGITDGMHDLRIVIINGTPAMCHVRVPAEGSFLANAAQGGNLTEVDCQNIPGKINKIVNEVSEIFSRNFNNPIYSLDFGIGKDGKPYIFEVNDQMGFPRWGMKNRDVFLKGIVENIAFRLQ